MLSCTMVEISLECTLPTTNHIYGQTRFGGRYLKKKAKQLKSSITLISKTKKHNWINRKTKLKATWYYYGSWYTKKGEIRKKDLTNITKLLEDGVFEGLGLDDSQVFEQVKYKIDDSSYEGFKVVLEEI